MANTWQILHGGLVYPVGILACLWLATPADAQASDTRNSQLPATIIARQGSNSIAALAAELEKQIAEDAPAMSDTIVNILTLLPNAPNSDAELMRTMPSRLATRAQEAEAAGRYDEATRFVTLAKVLGELLNGMAPRDARQRPPKADPLAPAGTSSSPSSAAALLPLPGDLARVDHVQTGDARASITMPPSPAAMQSQTPHLPAERASDNHSDIARASPVAGDKGPPTPARGSVQIAALLAELEQQIAENPLATAREIDDEVNTIVDILVLLPDAPSSDAELVLATPSNFAKRAREAEVSGRHDEANRLAAVGSVFGELLNKTAASAPLKLATNRSAPSDTAKPPPEPNLRTALREAPPVTTSSDAKSPSAERLNPAKLAMRPRLISRAAAVPGAPPRVAKQPPTKLTTAMANAPDPQCRAIVVKFEIGEEPSDAERRYLRHGCRPHG